MGWWQLGADTLAGGRFVLSPLAETTASLKLLHNGIGSHSGERKWLAAHLPAYRRKLAADPTSAALVRTGFAPRWNAEFLTPVPAPGASFAEEVAAVADTPSDEARRDLAHTLGRPLPTHLHRDDLPLHAAELLTWVWRTAVLPYWPRRRRVLEADVLARTERLSRGGWAAALDDLKPGMRWLGGGRLHINTRPHPPRRLDSVGLAFVPVTVATGWFCWRDSRYAVVYPCAGVLADGGAPGPPDALARLLGRGRAVVLDLLATPKSTTHLVALTGHGLGSVGRHLRVLLDAGLVSRARAGRSVLYVRTDAGEALVSASSGR